MNIVPRVATPHGAPALGAALLTAYTREFGRGPDRTTAELLLAQILIETARGAAIKNNSPGNISANSKWGGDAWRPPWFDEPTESTSERNRKLHAEMKAGRAPSAFRAFATLDLGMADYVRTLSRQFPTILAARTPEELAQAIFDSGYTRDHKPAEVAPTLAALVGNIREIGIFDDLTVRDAAPKAPALEAAAAASGLPSWSLVPCPLLQLGSAGPLVVLWQVRVNATLKPDGLFGAQTEQATRAWQARLGLPATGQVDAASWERLTGFSAAYERAKGRL